MPRSPLTESIQKVRRLVTEIQGTLTVDEFNLLLDELVPEPEPEVKQAKKTTARKIERCEACNYTRRALQHVNPQHTEYHEFVKAEKASKKSSTSKSATKSDRASGMAAQLKSRVSEQREAATTTKDDNYDGEGQCSDCGMAADMPIHSPEGGYITYHPFRSTAPPAPVSSSANGGAGSTTQNSEVSATSAGVATGGSGE